MSFAKIDADDVGKNPIACAKEFKTFALCRAQCRVAARAATASASGLALLRFNSLLIGSVACASVM